MVLIVLLYAVFSAMTFINSSLMASNPYPFFVGMLRAFGSSAILLGYCQLFYSGWLSKFSLPKRGWRMLLTYGVLIHGFVMCGFSYSMQYADPVTVCFIVASGPFLTAIIQYFRGEEALTSKKLIGLFIGVMGLLPILMSSSHDCTALKDPSLEWWGNLISLLSMLMFSYGWIVLKQFLKEFSYPIEIINGISMLIGGFVSFLLVLLVHGFSLFSLSFSADFPILMSAFLASSLLTYMLYVYLLERYSPTFVSFAGFLEPAFGMFYGSIIMGCVVTNNSIIALLFLLSGLYAFYREELKTSHTI